MNSNNPIVSVCMITYNHEKYIKEAIEGVLMQIVDFEMELIVADDCSSDKTGVIIEEIISVHPKGNLINYTRHTQNLGMMGNFFWALKFCKGKYIALCEGDDFWTLNNKLLQQVKLLESHNSFVLSFHDCNVIDSNGNEISPSRVPNYSQKNLNRDKIRHGSFIPTSTITFRKEALPSKFDDKLLNAYNGDTILLFFLSLKGTAHYENNFKASSYRKHSTGVWSILDENEKIRRSLITYELLRNSLSTTEKKFIDEFLCLLYYEFAKKEKKRSHLFMSMRSSLNVFNFKIFLLSIFKFIILR